MKELLEQVLGRLPGYADGSAFRLSAVLGLAAASVWAWVAWGAHRRAHRVSQARYTLALALLTTLGLAVLVLIVPTASIVESTPVRVEKPVLPELSVSGLLRALARLRGGRLQGDPETVRLGPYHAPGKPYDTCAAGQQCGYAKRVQR